MDKKTPAGARTHRLPESSKQAVAFDLIGGDDPLRDLLARHDQIAIRGRGLALDGRGGDAKTCGSSSSPCSESGVAISLISSPQIAPPHRMQ